ncbi:MAG: hypothetical protein QOJ16_3173 [Acidobacteriota bacterium]|nr:hypothetical protein [Acidobacteriota bacterium]
MTREELPRRRPRLDPRIYQISMLASLLVYGVFRLDFEVRPATAVALLGTALLTQYACTRLFRLPVFDPKSALISGLSLCLLLRSSSLQLAILAAAVTIGSKFFLRWRGKHIFNPTNFGLMAMIVATGKVWVSPGQWGNAAFLAFLFACLGGLVVNRAERSDVTYAFLSFYLALLFGRALWLGAPFAIPLHQLANGAFLLFTFFMISDPKTTPDSRAGRILFAGLVALVAGTITFVLYRTNGLLYALALCSPVVPLIDLLLPGKRHAWRREPIVTLTGGVTVKRLTVPAAVALGLLLSAGTAHAFCGFYVAKADSKLFNKASQVVLVRDDDHTVLTMANDYKGDLKEFAIVIPVPTFLERGQIHVADKGLIDHLDAYSAPRLTEYYDEDPCTPVQPMMMEDRAVGGVAGGVAAGVSAKAESRVRIEASYTVGEYDILILSAKESHSLADWLKENGYRVPPGAARVLGGYIKQGMHFFVAKVNLKEQGKLGYSALRPLQVAYTSPKFMLPIRLGMVNADGPQELFVYALTRKGRVETTNYRTVKLPSSQEVPLFIKDEFGAFYKSLFAAQVKKEEMRTVFLEYAWNMGSCDPCSSEPLGADELKELGVTWGDGGTFLSRLHLRYDAPHFPEDLVFQETADEESFQGLYVLRHPWAGKPNECKAARAYFREVGKRQDKEAVTLASLTGWDVSKIRGKMHLKTKVAAKDEPWWKEIWTN